MFKRFIHIWTILVTVVIATAASCNPDNPPGPVGPVTPTGDETITVTASDIWDGTKRADISYQLLVYSFADSDGDGWGDFRGIISKLDYLDAMGVSAIWLSPIHPSGSYHGYDVEDYSSINPKFGTMADFKELVSQAHRRNIKIYLDYVLNHSGANHPWFREAISDKTSPYRDYYIFSSDPQADIKAGKIPMIASEGAAGYDSGQWFSTTSGVGASDKLMFHLDWSNSAAPTITVSHHEGAVDPDNNTSYSGEKFLYFGDGICKRFYSKGAGIYELAVDFNSDWGFLIRSSNTSWNAGTKYGAASNKDIITFGVPFKLSVSTSSFDPVNIQFSAPELYHSHFWTGSFADLNYGAAQNADKSPAFKAVVDGAKVWIDAGVDGFRLDAVKHIYHNENSDENPVFLKKFYDAVNSYYRYAGHSSDIYMVGEVMSEYDKVAPYYVGLPALFEFSFWWRLSSMLKGDTKPIAFPATIMSYQSSYSQYRTNYIEPTKLSNHDEVRVLTELSGSKQKARMAACILLTSGGSPYVYYGEELGYPGNKDKGDEYVRQPMYWGDSFETSYTDKIDASVKSAVGSVSAQASDNSSMLSLYRRLCRARNQYPALANGKMSAHPVLNPNTGASLYPNIAAWYMTSGSEKLLVVHNVSATNVEISLGDSLNTAIFVEGTVQVKKASAGYKLKMSGWSSVIFKL